MSLADKLAGVDPNKEATLGILQTAIALAISFAICKFSTQATRTLGIQGGDLPCITALIVILATIFPTTFSCLAPTGDSIALILLQVLYSFLLKNVTSFGFIYIDRAKIQDLDFIEKV